MPSVADVRSSMIENVRSVIEEHFENQNPTISGRIQSSSKVEQISRYLYRAPFERQPGGIFGKYNPDGGAFHLGSSLDMLHLTAGYVPSQLSYRATQEQIKSTENREVAVTPYLARQMASATRTFQIMLDIAFFGSGTGVLTDSSSAITGTSGLTLGTGNLGVSRLRQGMGVDVWDVNLSTKRSPASAASPLYIVSIDYANRKVVLNQNVTGLTQGDVLAFKGLDSTFSAGSPAALTSFAAGWPTAPGSQTANQVLGGDSYMHGMYYAHDAITTNYFLGQLKSTVPTLLSENVAVNGAITFSHGKQLLDQLATRWDESVTAGIEFIFHPTQARQVWEIGAAISNVYVAGANKLGSIPDLGDPKTQSGETFSYCGKTAHIWKRQDPTRVDAIRFQDWGRTQAWPFQLYDQFDGRKFIQGYDSDGRPTTYIEWVHTYAADWICFNPGKSGYLSGLTVPA